MKPRNVYCSGEDKFGESCPVSDNCDRCTKDISVILDNPYMNHAPFNIEEKSICDDYIPIKEDDGLNIIFFQNFDEDEDDDVILLEDLDDDEDDNTITDKYDPTRLRFLKESDWQPPKNKSLDKLKRPSPSNNTSSNGHGNSQQKSYHSMTYTISVEEWRHILMHEPLVEGSDQIYVLKNKEK